MKIFICYAVSIQLMHVMIFWKIKTSVGLLSLGGVCVFSFKKTNHHNNNPSIYAFHVFGPCLYESYVNQDDITVTQYFCRTPIIRTPFSKINYKSNSTFFVRKSYIKIFSYLYHEDFICYDVSIQLIHLI